MNIKLHRPIVFLDLETTGLNLTTDRVVEIAMIRVNVDGTNLIKRKLVNPERPIPEESSAIHGITNEISTNSGHHIFEILTEFFQHLRSVDKLVGHNIIFDINMIKIELLRIINSNFMHHKKIKLYKYDFHFLSNYDNISVL